MYTPIEARFLDCPEAVTKANITHTPGTAEPKGERSVETVHDNPQESFALEDFPSYFGD